MPGAESGAQKKQKAAASQATRPPMSPVTRSLSRMHVREYMYRVVEHQVHNKVRKTTHRMGATHAFHAAEGRERVWCLQHIERALAHFGEEIQAKPRNGGLVAIRSVLEFRLRLGLDVELQGHGPLSLDSSRSKT